MYSKAENTLRSVLVVEDEAVNREMLGLILSSRYNVLYAEDGQQAINVLQEHSGSISVVLTDLLMPVLDGFELIKFIRGDSELRKIPIIVLTSESDAEVKSLNLGAVDFIKKPYDMPEIILARVQRIIDFAEDRSLIKATQYDAVTGLYNREYFFEYVGRLRRHHPERKVDVSVLDISRFHMVNELYGRAFGNKVLKTVADTIIPFLEANHGIGCRQEQDVFIMFCVHQDGYDGLIHDILENLKSLNTSIRFHLRLGVYSNVSSDVDLMQQIDRAKAACNSLRNDQSRSMVTYDEEMHKKALLAERLINDMQRALDEHQFKVFYQPKYNIRGEKPVLRSSEALVRWQHPELGMISPGVFIPLFEDNGMILHLDNYVWKEAAKQVRAWKDKYKQSVSVSVNVSRIDLYDPGILDTFRSIIADNGLSNDDYLLEVTESAYSDDTAHMIEVVGKLRDLGLKVEMDDFGAGYSSLNMLSMMPVDVIKLDMSFIRKLHESDLNPRMVELVVNLAKSMNVPVVAEGVENESQYKTLRDLGCDFVQGFYFSRPLPAADFEKLLAAANER